MYRHLRERSVESGYMLSNFSELKSGGGGIPMLSPRPEKWGGGRIPPSPTDRRPCPHVLFVLMPNEMCLNAILKMTFDATFAI